MLNFESLMMKDKFIIFKDIEGIMLFHNQSFDNYTF